MLASLARRSPLPLVGLALLVLLAAPGAADDEEAPAAHVSKVWERSCAKCHAVPDATFETGRAFLRQITETS